MGESLELHHFSLSTDETNAAIIARMLELSTGSHSIMRRFAKKTMHTLLMREAVVGKCLMLKASTPQNRTCLPIDIDSRS